MYFLSTGIKVQQLNFLSAMSQTELNIHSVLDTCPHSHTDIIFILLSKKKEKKKHLLHQYLYTYIQSTLLGTAVQSFSIAAYFSI